MKQVISDTSRKIVSNENRKIQERSSPIVLERRECPILLVTACNEAAREVLPRGSSGA